MEVNCGEINMYGTAPVPSGNAKEETVGAVPVVGQS